MNGRDLNLLFESLNRFTNPHFPISQCILTHSLNNDDNLFIAPFVNALFADNQRRQATSTDNDTKS